jgi:hypothetical protein
VSTAIPKFLNPLKEKRYRRSLKAFLGYRRADRWATAFDVSAVEVLGLMLAGEGGFLADFLTRYPRSERVKREKEVKVAIIGWLAAIAGGVE